MAINSYHSQYPKEYYEIGEVYSFYYPKSNSPTTRYATEKEISDFSNKLLNIGSPLSDNAANPEVGRSYGIVIDIKKEEKLTALYVMFANNEKLNKFIVKKYAIEYDAVVFNDKEWYEPGLVTITNNPVTQTSSKIGQPIPGGKIGQPVPNEKIGQPIPGGKIGQPVPNEKIGQPIPKK